MGFVDKGVVGHGFDPEDGTESVDPTKYTNTVSLFSNPASIGF